MERKVSENSKKNAAGKNANAPRTGGNDANAKKKKGFGAGSDQKKLNT